MTTISILGVSGSIGRQTLEICRWLNAFGTEKVTVAAMSAGSDWQTLAAAAREFHPRLVALNDAAYDKELREALADLPQIEIACGTDAPCRAAETEADTLVAAISGMACLAPLLCAVRQGKKIALANKEALVAAGSIVTELAAQYGARLQPVDSEHSALWQCLRGEEKNSVSRLILTASGGPFRCRPERLEEVTPAQALSHPSWNMGAKITIDSATMVNKGLEIIEAHWLFGLDYDHIDVVIHPESIIHSLVEFADGSQKALLSVPDMRLPIQYAITGQMRQSSPLQKLDLAKLGKMSFFAPDERRFPALSIFREAGRQGGLLPAYLNGANEVLTAMFLAGQMPFTHITLILEKLAEQGYAGEANDIEAVYAADKAGREDAARLIVR